MVPRTRRLPDLCIIVLLQQMPLNDQLRAGRMNTRWTALLRAANRRVRLLKIYCEHEERNSDNLKFAQNSVNFFRFDDHSRSLAMLTSDDGQPLYPVTRMTKWNCLIMQKVKEFTVSQIINAFSAITDLTFFAAYLAGYMYLFEMLELHPTWSRQLTSFALIDLDYGDNATLPSAIRDRLFVAINTSMPALQRLAIDSFRSMKEPFDLPIIAQLDLFSVMFFPIDSHIENLIPSLNRYAGEGAGNLKILLDDYDDVFLTLSEEARDQIIRLSDYCSDFSNNDLLSICNSFRSLTTFSLSSNQNNLDSHLIALSQLTQMVHLSLRVYLKYHHGSTFYNNSTRPMAVLRSVRAFDLNLTITGHHQVDWLNLGHVLPNLEAIHLKNFKCESCRVSNWNGKYDKAERTKTLRCLLSVLPQLHLGLPLNRILLDFFNYRTAEELCIAAKKKLPF